MITTEQSILDRTIELDRLRIDQGQLSAAQEATVSGLARQQSMLEAETREHADKLKASEAFALVLGEVCRRHGPSGFTTRTAQYTTSGAGR